MNKVADATKPQGLVSHNRFVGRTNFLLLPLSLQPMKFHRVCSFLFLIHVVSEITFAHESLSRSFQDFTIFLLHHFRKLSVENYLN